MGLIGRERAETYGLEPAFERALVVGCCRNPKLYGRIGYALDPEMIRDAVLRSMIETAQSIAREVGHGPVSALHVLQRMRRLHENGLIDWETLLGASEAFDDEDDAGPLDPEVIVTEMTPIVQAALRRTAIREGVSDYGKRRDLSKIVAMEQMAQRVGKVDTSIGVQVGEAAKQEIAEFLALERLPTGVIELDVLLDGGMFRQGLGMVIGDSGAGKSLYLNQITVHACLSGVLSCFASIELPRPMALARMLAAFTNIPTKVLMKRPGALDEALRAMLELPGPVQPCVIQRFDTDTTTVVDVVQWVDSVEQHYGREVGLVTIDYGDKMMAPSVRGGGERGTYDAGKVVWEGMKDFAENRNKWVWTGSQSKDQGAVGKRKKPPKLRQGDACDSKWKGRVSDLVVTINPDAERRFVSLLVDKYRMDESGRSTGMLPTDYAHGRLTAGAIGEEDL